MKRKIGILLAMGMMMAVGGWADATQGSVSAARSAGQQDAAVALSAPALPLAASAITNACINGCKYYEGKRCTGTQSVSCVYSTCTRLTCYCEGGTYVCLPW